jgi:hypothetical protein
MEDVTNVVDCMIYKRFGVLANPENTVFYPWEGDENVVPFVH